MTSLHTNRQITVASVLLLMVAAFVLNPLEYRGRTQVRHRTARAVRIDDHDSDHTRWQAHAFDLNHTDTQGDNPSAAPSAFDVPPPALRLSPQFRSEGLIAASGSRNPVFQSACLPPSRAPPSFFAI